MNQVTKILDAVKAGNRLSEADALHLYEHADLLELGAAANEVNQAKNNNDVFYNVNRHINPTNVCAMSCKFCAFSRKPGQDGAYEYTIDEMVAKAGQAVKSGATEVHMVGGLHPRWRFTHYLEILSAIKAAHPSLHIKAFTAVEIDWLAAKARLSIEATLEQLKAAGLDSMPGGGAEIFHPEVRNRICDTKTDAERWIMIHRAAHSVGLRSNCTMLYGHIERLEHRVDHMRRLRALQDETEGFNVFIPLAFQPFDNDMGISRYTVGIDDLRTLAISRLFLDNFRHIKAYWIMLGQDIAQLGLNFGANDLDGTVKEEKISRMAGGRAGMAMDKTQIHSLIRKAGKTPVERDTLYNHVWRDADENQLYNDTEKQAAATMLLYRIENGERLAADQAGLLADHAHLFQLGHCAQHVRDKLGTSLQATITQLLTEPLRSELSNPSSYLTRLQAGEDDIQNGYIRIDLAQEQVAGEPASLSELTDFVKTVRAALPEVKIELAGIKSIWTIARASSQSLEDAVEQLSAAGLTTIASSHLESETDLTTNEVIDFHRLCHQFDIDTNAKLELSADFTGIKHPFWKPFIKRLDAFTKLQEETKGIQQVSVDVFKDSRVTPTEYFRAVAIARILCQNIPDVLAPVQSIPTIRPRLNHYENPLHDPVLKIAPLAVAFGASNLGSLPGEGAFAGPLAEELKISGFVPSVNGANTSAAES